MKSSTNRIVGGLIIIIGALILIDNVFGGFDFWDFIWKLWPLVLIVLGVYLIKNQRKIKGGVDSGDIASENVFFGDLDINLTGKEAAGRHYSALIGDIRIDLSSADFKDGENKISASSLIGDIRIKIPDHLPVKLSSRSVIGDIRFDDLRRDGFFQKLDHYDNDFRSSEKKLSITASCIIGDSNIDRIKIDNVN
jgi:lia operon protein LiaF